MNRVVATHLRVWFSILDPYDLLNGRIMTIEMHGSILGQFHSFSHMFGLELFQLATHTLVLIVVGFGLGKRAGRGALKLLKRPARFGRCFVPER